MVCGSPVEYFSEERLLSCAYCGRELPANAACRDGHFVCDACHAADSLAVVERVSIGAGETDLLALFEEIKSHSALPVNGPEHHGVVPGVILAAYRNSGGTVSDEMIRLGILRGARLPGGFCAFHGACAAAVGVGIAFSVILGANPLTPVPRHTVGLVTAQVMRVVAEARAARCCRRECLAALVKAADLSREHLPLDLTARRRQACRQGNGNPECIGTRCPFLKA
jgi:hypothetical protein